MRSYFCFVFILFWSIFSLSEGTFAPQQRHRPKTFVSLHDVDPTILLDIRYYSLHNFVGSPVMGYDAPLCLLTKQAAHALSSAQQDFLQMRYSLKVYDCLFLSLTAKNMTGVAVRPITTYRFRGLYSDCYEYIYMSIDPFQATPNCYSKMV